MKKLICFLFFLGIGLPSFSQTKLVAKIPLDKVRFAKFFQNKESLFFLFYKEGTTTLVVQKLDRKFNVLNKLEFDTGNPRIVYDEDKLLVFKDVNHKTFLHVIDLKSFGVKKFNLNLRFSIGPYPFLVSDYYYFSSFTDSVENFSKDYVSKIHFGNNYVISSSVDQRRLHERFFKINLSTGEISTANFVDNIERKIANDSTYHLYFDSKEKKAIKRLSHTGSYDVFTLFGEADSVESKPLIIENSFYKFIDTSLKRGRAVLEYYDQTIFYLTGNGEIVKTDLKKIKSLKKIFDMRLKNKELFSDDFTLHSCYKKGGNTTFLFEIISYNSTVFILVTLDKNGKPIKDKMIIPKKKINISPIVFEDKMFLFFDSNLVEEYSLNTFKKVRLIPFNMNNFYSSQDVFKIVNDGIYKFEVDYATSRQQYLKIYKLFDFKR